MDNSKNGGSAFPCEGGFDSNLYPDPGMSLRDYFAAAALAATIDDHGPLDVGYREGVCERAYMVADAMLAAREKADG